MNTLLRPAFNEGRGDFTRWNFFLNILKFRKNSKLYFIPRKGDVGDWINHFDESVNKQWDIWIKENLDRIGITDHGVRAFFKIEDK